MSRCCLTLSLLLFSLSAWSQIEFEPGFFLDNRGERTDCLIKNEGWRNNPDQFTYQISPGGTQQEATLEEVRAFGFESGPRYERYTVAMDVSPTLVGELNRSRDPIFDTTQVFLKVLVEGEADLFQYTGLGNGSQRFFFRLAAENPQPLVYKQYLKEGQVATNARYQQQIYRFLGECSEIRDMDLSRVAYRDKDLVSIFSRYHGCVQAPFVSYLEKRGRNQWFRLSLRPGLRYTKFAMASRQGRSFDADFEAILHPRFGIGLEFVMPFNRNKWSVMVEPTLQLYQQSSFTEGGRATALTHRSLETNFAIRHYFFLSDQSQVFVSVGGVIDVPFDSQVEIERLVALEVSPAPSLFFGAGYGLGKRWQGEVRYNHWRELMNSYLSWVSRYRTLELILSYRLF